jgi:hypothetical protein
MCDESVSYGFTNPMLDSGEIGNRAAELCFVWITDPESTLISDGRVMNNALLAALYHIGQRRKSRGWLSKRHVLCEV